MQLFDNIGEVVFTFVLKTLGAWHIEQRFVGQIFSLAHLYRMLHIKVSVTSSMINYNIYWNLFLKVYTPSTTIKSTQLSCYA